METSEVFYMRQVLGIETWISDFRRASSAVTVLVFESLNKDKLALIEKMFAAIQCNNYEVKMYEPNVELTDVVVAFGDVPSELSNDPRVYSGAPALSEMLQNDQPEITQSKKRQAWTFLQNFNRNYNT